MICCVNLSPPPPLLQENQLASSLHIDSSNLAASAALIQDKIMAASLSSQLEEELRQHLAQEPFSESFVAVRSSGMDEDSATHSFAGQFGMLIGLLWLATCTCTSACSP